MSEHKKLVTYALPYANGSLHLGHALGMVQVDCYVRASRYLGQEICFVCGNDAHGTPIMLNAKKQNLSPEALIQKIYKEHVNDIECLGVKFDHFHTTHCQLNTDIVHTVYQRLCKGSLIKKQAIEQAYDQKEAMFLPDRYLKGECPLCHAKDQYGDHCEACGKTYEISKLKNPISVMSDQRPVWRQSDHYFYKLSEKQLEIGNWLSSAQVQLTVQNKLSEWFGVLQDWDISRDAPYFGIPIPNAENKYFYVWLDAPFGYLSAMGDYYGLKDPQKTFDKWNEYDIEHFIGKDIIYFHGVFWPSVLESVQLKQPNRLHVHGFLTISGDKMSKSRGTFVLLKDYLDVLPADMLRYYFASRLSPNITDVDLSFPDFMQKVNSDLIGKLINIGHRMQGFLHKHYNGELGSALDNELWGKLIDAQDELESAYCKVDLASVCRTIMLLCDQVNQYIDAHKPWMIAKTEEKENLQIICTTTLNAFRFLVYRLAPVVPEIAAKVANSFGEEVSWDKIPLHNHTCQPFEHLLGRVTEDQVDFS